MGNAERIIPTSTIDPPLTISFRSALSYYIGKPAMERVLESLSALAPDLSIIFEHLKPYRLISEERRFIPHGIFSQVRDYTHLHQMTTYSEDDISTTLGPDFSFRYCDMDAMELGWIGSYRYFPTPDVGWLSCAVAVRRPDTGITGEHIHESQNKGAGDRDASQEFINKTSPQKRYDRTNEWISRWLCLERSIPTDYTIKYKENSGNKEGYGQRCRVPEDSRTSVQHTT